MKDPTILGYQWGDLQGNSDGSTITIDTDNLGDDPFSLLDTIAHEDRHILQQYYVDHPDQIPEGFDQATVDTWRSNLPPDGQYHQPSLLFNGRYWNQSVEVDARGYAADYLASYFNSQDNYNSFMGTYASQGGS